MNGLKPLFLGAAIVAAAAMPATAQALRYDVKTINYDMWCQEQAHLPPARCDKREPQDVARFRTFRAKVEKYEIPYLQRKEHDEEIDKLLMDSDPLSNADSRESTTQATTPLPEAATHAPP